MDENKTGLERFRAIALYFTMAMAVLALVCWGLSAATGSDALRTLTGFFSGATTVGGTCMGILFLVARARERHTADPQA